MELKERILEEMITPFNREERKLIDEIMIEYKFGGLKPIYQNMTENEVREVVENLIIKNRGE